jgi:hypothetical protein
MAADRFPPHKGNTETSSEKEQESTWKVTN